MSKFRIGADVITSNWELSNKDVNMAVRSNREPFRFKIGGKVKIVSKEQCKTLDKKYYNKDDHSFMGGKTATIKTDSKGSGLSLQVYEIEEAEGYYWEDEYFD